MATSSTCTGRLRSTDLFYACSVRAILGSAGLPLETAGVDPVLDALNAVSNGIDRLEIQQPLGFGHTEGDLVSLRHAPRETHIHLDAGHNAFDNLNELGAPYRRRTAAIEDFTNGPGVIRNRQEHPGHIAHVHIVAKLFG